MVIEAIFLIFGAFIVTYIDVVLGMGLGSLGVPLFILFGYSPLEIIPAILLLEFITGIFSGLLHHQEKNINLHDKMVRKIIGLFVLIGIVGAGAGVYLATHIETQLLNILIGFIVLVAGILVFIRRKVKRMHMALDKVIPLGIFASFTKAFAGVYGPIVATGHILSGVKSRYAVALTKLSEGLVSLIALIFYLILNSVTFPNIVLMLIGALAAVPVGTYSVRVLPDKYLRYGVGVLSVLLGLAVIIRA